MDVTKQDKKFHQPSLVATDGKLLCLLSVLCVLCTVSAWAAPGPPDAATLLYRADLVRNPFLGTAIDLELIVSERDSDRELRRSGFLMLTHRNDRTLMLMPSAEDPPGALLIADDTYWLLLPKAERPTKLALRHVVAGDLSHAGFLRLNLRLRYTPRLDGAEVVEGTPCWRLELLANDEAPFPRVRYWIAEEGFRPMRMEFFGADGARLKTVRFTGYQQTGRGPRPARIEIEDDRRPEERAVLILGKPRPVLTSNLAFDVEDLLALRRAASREMSRSEAESVAGIEARALTEALAISARQREETSSNPVPE